MSRKPVRFLMAVMVLVMVDEAHGFEHLKHKFKLKKLAKLAFAAKLLAPHLIPLPIPFPIMRRPRHKEHFKVIEEDEPWTGQGWEMGGGGEGRDQGWDFSPNSNQGGWNFNGGWQQMQGWQPQMTLPEGWNSQQGFGGNVQKIVFHEQRIPSLKGGHDEEHGGQHSHQIEIREEIIPALRAAGFVGDPNGVMMKLQHGAESGNAAVWDEMPDFEGSAYADNHPHASAPGGWSPPEQSHVAEVHEVKEIKDATIVQHPPFDVQNAKLGHFDVSEVPVRPIRASRQRSQLDPWPQNVAESPANDAAVRNYFSSNQAPVSAQRQPPTGHGTGLEDVGVDDKLVIKEERHQAQDSQPYAKISPEAPHRLPFSQSKNQHDWQPMTTSADREEPQTERDAHKRS